MRSDVKLAALLLCVSAVSSAHPLDTDSMYQARDSPIAALFSKRAPNPSDSNFTANYPAAGSTPQTSSIPSAWLTRLGQITLPNVSVSTQNNGYPTYPNNEPGQDSTICSFTYECHDDGDLYQPANGTFALSFDDGPGDASPTLYSYLQNNSISDKATHFMIGGNILYSPTVMQQAFSEGGHIAVHTWSHPYMTTLSNEQVVAELGWTMQIIYDLTGGRLAKFWRPPYGDVDNRVRAIAKQVFGLETVVWDQDTGDWAIGSDANYTPTSVHNAYVGWLSDPNKPGLLVLEHEIATTEVDVFLDIYPYMVQYGWNVQNVANAFNFSMYQNANSDTDTPESATIGTGPVTIGQSTTSSSAAPTSTSASSTANAIASTSGSSSASASGSGASASASASAKSSADRHFGSPIMPLLAGVAIPLMTLVSFA